MKFVHQIGFLEATLGSLEGCWVWRRLPSLLNRVAVDGLGGLPGRASGLRGAEVDEIHEAAQGL